MKTPGHVGNIIKALAKMAQHSSSSKKEDKATIRLEKINTSAIKIQSCFRGHLVRTFPVMIGRVGLKEIPRLKLINSESKKDKLLWGARVLVVYRDQDHLISEDGAYGDIFRGELSGKGVAVKIGWLPELNRTKLEPLLEAKNSGVKMIVPLPVKYNEDHIYSSKSSNREMDLMEPSLDIGVMPLMDSNLEDYLYDLKDKGSSDSDIKALEDIRDSLFTELESLNIFHGDRRNPNILVKNGEFWAADFGQVNFTGNDLVLFNLPES